MNHILLIGNGFDLGHNLPTSYNDFLYLLKNWNDFMMLYKKTNFYGLSIDKEVFRKYFKNPEELDNENIEKLNRKINKNSWIKYYCNCEAEIDGWIDFEKELIPVIALFEEIFKANYEIKEMNNSIHISINYFSNGSFRVAQFWEKYMQTYSDKIVINTNYCNAKYGILKKKIIKELRDEWDEFINVFELYLLEFVHKRSDNQPLPQIQNLDITHVISFNYTLTESLYKVPQKNIHHIHGMIRADMNSTENNMVMGINEQNQQNIDFIYFVKYFQRIQKNVGINYKEFVDEYHHSDGTYCRDPYILYIYGHSLDETDEDIMKYVIGNISDVRCLGMKPRKLVIFFYDNTDYEQKVINLIKLYGRSIVEHCLEAKTFEFIPIEREN